MTGAPREVAAFLVIVAASADGLVRHAPGTYSSVTSSVGAFSSPYPLALPLRFSLPACCCAAADTDAHANTLVATIVECGVESAHDGWYRVTASDVASELGNELSTAAAALTQLTAQLDGAMEVTDRGHIIYAFPRDVRRRLSRAYLRSSRDGRTQRRARWAVEVLIGLPLVASAALVSPLLPGSRLRLGAQLGELRDVAERNIGAADASIRDVTSAPRAPLGAGVRTLARACYAFLLGDGGDEACAAKAAQMQWAAMARAIRRHKGVVCEEQLLPYMLDTRYADGGLVHVREGSDSFSGSDDDGDGVDGGRGSSSELGRLVAVNERMLPIVARFDGQPLPTADGDIVYAFATLLSTTTRDTKCVGNAHAMHM